MAEPKLSIEDKFEIHELIARYNHAIDGGRPEVSGADGREARPPCQLPWLAIAIAVAALVGGAGLLAAADGAGMPHTLLQPMVLLAAAGTVVTALALLDAFERALRGEAVS